MVTGEFYTLLFRTVVYTVVLLMSIVHHFLFRSSKNKGIDEGDGESTRNVTTTHRLLSSCYRYCRCCRDHNSVGAVCIYSTSKLGLMQFLTRCILQYGSVGFFEFIYSMYVTSTYLNYCIKRCTQKCLSALSAVMCPRKKHPNVFAWHKIAGFHIGMHVV